MAAQTHSFDIVSTVPQTGYISGHDSSLQPQPELQVIRRDGSFSAFDSGKISVAITKAFVAVEGTEATASRRIRDAVESLAPGRGDAKPPIRTGAAYPYRRHSGPG